jgi:hypothetical protein
MQFGLDWPGVVALPASPELMVLLQHLDGVRTVDMLLSECSRAGAEPAVVQSLLGLLQRTGLVVDQADAVHGGAGTSPPSWASTWLSTPPGARAADLEARRRAVTYAVVGSGAVAGAVRRALAADRVSDHPDRASFLVIAADGEPDRSLADAGLRRGSPHLVVHVRDTVGVLGPLVIPGATACLRCVDAGRAALDPAWPTLVTAATTRPGISACDPTLATLVGVWAVREARSWAAGLGTPTVGGTIEVPVGSDPPELRRWQLHPHCGCWWQQPAVADEMSAPVDVDAGAQ